MIEENQKRGELLMRIVMCTLALSAMSVLIFNFVLADIQDTFQISTAQVSWVTSVYGLIYGIGTVIYGKLADRYRLKHVLTFGLVIFASGSLIGLMSQTFSVLLFARCLQAAGASAIPATAMLIPLRYFPPEKRGSAIATAFVGLALGTALGPIVSALIVSFAHWRWLFCVPLFILLTLPFYHKYLQEDEAHQSGGTIDWIGGGFLAITVTFLLLSITNGTLLLAVGSAITLGLFIFRIRSTSEPFIESQLFKNKAYTIGLAMALLISGIGVSLYFLSPLLLAEVQQLPANWIGFFMVPAAVASALMGRKGGKLADTKGNPFLFYTASGLLIGCFFLLALFTWASPVFIAAFLILGNVGQTFMMVAISNSVSMTLAKKEEGVGMGLLALMNFLSTGMAVGVYGKVIDLGSKSHWFSMNVEPNVLTYSNIFFVLALLHLLVLALYVGLAKVKQKKTYAKNM
ncbi:MFS transporter [Halalkalibacterium halodurans]|uniref:MFS transporter n=1 Tax=Halalkalibacterium halodurans TaxID=86665 RepID=UPI002E1A2265|nr:MFS transporter [Halalkalibacterium halodurans]